MRMRLMLGMLLGVGALQGQSVIYLHTPSVGDANYAWNSRYGGDGYTGVGDDTIEANRSFYSGVPSDTQFTVGIFMIPLAPLSGGDLLGATLQVYSNGFSYWWHYASAQLGWLDTSVALPSPLEGDVVADGLGPFAKSLPGGFLIYDSYVSGSGAPGWKEFDVTTQLQADLDVGRTFSVFVLSTSRDSAGSLASAETGMGPRVIAWSTIPEPTSAAWLLGLAAGLMVLLRRPRR
jgi:hypothetical protein